MADKTQHVMWTALPNGVTANRDAYRVSVLVSPRLTRTPSVPPQLGEFPDFADWPNTLSHAKIDFTYGNLAIPAAPPASAPSRKTWRAIFPSTPLVRPHQFENRRNDTVLSYPLAVIHDFVHDAYADLVRD